MRLVRSIGMNTDHGYYGNPTEVTRVDLYVSKEMDRPEIVAELKRLQVLKLHSCSDGKRMPHWWIQNPHKREYASELSQEVKP